MDKEKVLKAMRKAGVKYEWRDIFGNWRMEEQLVFCFDKENYREVVETPKPPFPDLGGIQNRIREALNIEGKHGNWNFDPYMHGMYNGMEFALSIAEDREPQYKDAPARWLYKCKGIEETPKPTIPHLESHKRIPRLAECIQESITMNPNKEYRAKPKTEKRYMAMFRMPNHSDVWVELSSDRDRLLNTAEFNRWIIVGDIVEREVEL